MIEIETIDSYKQGQNMCESSCYNVNNQSSLIRGRDVTVDFTKGILILLMVLFHLTYFVTRMPIGSQSLIYMFHMPAFLVLSGFFTSTDNPLKRLNNMLRSVLIPYIIFEAIYLIGLGILGKEVGANNKFEFTVPNFIDKICFSPIGTYWYLHTLVICASVYILFSFPRLRLCKVNTLVCSVIVCFSISVLIDGLQWVNCMYFFVGAYIRILCKDIKQVILPSVLSLLGVVILCFTIE